MIASQHKYFSLIMVAFIFFFILACGSTPTPAPPEPPPVPEVVTDTPILPSEITVTPSPTATLPPPRVDALALVIDNSGSMNDPDPVSGRPAIVDTLEAALMIIEAAKVDTQIGIITFKQEDSSLFPFVLQPLTSDKDALRQAVQSIVADGGTPLYASIVLANEMLANSPQRSAIMLITDGKDNEISSSEAEAISAARSNRRPVFTIGFGDGINTQILEEIGRYTNGFSVIQPDATSFRNSLEQIFQFIETFDPNMPLPDWLTPTPKPVTPTFTPTVTLEPGSQSKTVLWDVGHGPREGQDGAYTPAGVYSDLAKLLYSFDIEIESYAGSLENVDLDHYGAVVLAATSAIQIPYQSGEIDALRRFVDAGGSLLIMGENSQFTNLVGTVAAAFGVGLAGTPDLWEAGNLGDHPIFAGVNAVKFYQGGTLTLQDPDAWTLASEGSHPAVVTLDRPIGRILVMCDSNMFDDRMLAENTTFALNVFRWLLHMD